VCVTIVFKGCFILMENYAMVNGSEITMIDGGGRKIRILPKSEAHSA